MSNRLQSFILNGLIFVNVSGYVSWVVYAIAFIALLFKKPDWVGPWVFSLVQHLNVIGIPFIALFVVLSFIPATRGLGGLLGIVVSRIYSLGGTLTALLIVYSCWGVFGIIVGTGLLGFGILPVGIISSILLHDKIFLTTLLQFTAFILIGQFAGRSLITKWAAAEARKAAALLDTPASPV